MRFVTFRKGKELRVGVLAGKTIVDLAVAAPKLPRSLKGILAAGKSALAEAKKAAAKPRKGSVLKASSVKLAPPLPDPGKILCVGLNYKDHAAETGNPLPTYPVIFTRFVSTLCADGEKMTVPKASDMLDYEAELAVIIGKKGRNIPVGKALAHVAGYSCFNDGSVRDFQMRTSQFTLGKNFDATGGFGPWMVTADELPAGAKGLKIESRLNGHVMQSDNTDNMMFPIAETLVDITQGMTLEPGDLVVTGTPSGVGFARKPPVWMKAGDTIEIEIEKVGLLRNPIENEK